MARANLQTVFAKSAPGYGAAFTPSCLLIAVLLCQRILDRPDAASGSLIPEWFLLLLPSIPTRNRRILLAESPRDPRNLLGRSVSAGSRHHSHYGVPRLHDLRPNRRRRGEIWVAVPGMGRHQSCAAHVGYWHEPPRGDFDVKP